VTAPFFGDPWAQTTPKVEVLEPPLICCASVEFFPGRSGFQDWSYWQSSGEGRGTLTARDRRKMIGYSVDRVALRVLDLLRSRKGCKVAGVSEGRPVTGKILSVICSNMQFLMLNQHIITKVSPQMSNYTKQKFHWGNGGPDL